MSKNNKPVSSLPRKTREQILNERFPSGLRVDISRHDWRNIILVIISWLLYIASAFMISYAIQQMILTDNIQKTVASNVINDTKTWPTADVKDQYYKAKAYNDNMLANGVQAIGDAVDPTDGKRIEEKDTAYQDALNINGSGAMAVLNIPKISSEMTIYHGTTDDVLTAGVGVAALGGIVYGAFLYTSAGGNPDKVKRAREIFVNVVIGVIAFAAMYALLNFLIPGGVFS